MPPVLAATNHIAWSENNGIILLRSSRDKGIDQSGSFQIGDDQSLHQKREQWSDGTILHHLLIPYKMHCSQENRQSTRTLACFVVVLLGQLTGPKRAEICLASIL